MEPANSKLVWYPEPSRGYAVGKIVDIAASSVSVEPVWLPVPTSLALEAVNASLSLQGELAGCEPRKLAYECVFPCDEVHLSALIERRFSDLVDVDDNCALLNLNVAALLENVRLRFHRDKIYTYVAHILIAVNPYYDVPGLHSAEAIQKYQGKSLGTLPPHVYAIADKAFRDMKAFKQSQSIIINGESGAGKTESQKYVLRYLCLSGSQSGRLEKLILDANPLLEAFGNAKTIRNNNSSRFGKFIEIHYSNKFTVSGGLFLHYLLEKSRICTQSMGERNYHIFYQLCACLPKDQWRHLELAAPDKFRYLSGGCTQYFCSQDADRKLGPERKSELHQRQGAIQDQLIDDVKCYEQTDWALNNFGVNVEQKQAIYSIVAAVLHLGNITFSEDPDDNRGGCRLEQDASSKRALEVASRLMGLDMDLLSQSLTSRIMSTSRAGHKGTVYMVQLSVPQAQAARDALAKAIYSKLFDYIVTKIVNKSIPFSTSAYYIGVLDVAGFEYFQHNSFEQFLINFCNEKLQQFFNERILKEEQSIYEKEGLNLKKVDFIDNQDCIQLFEAKASGIFDLLDEESRLPKPSAQHFTQCVHAANKTHFRLAVPRMSKLKAHREIRDDEGFLVRHFAGAVCYETNSFIEKNNDALHASLKNLMLDADHELLRELFTDGPTANSTGGHLPLSNFQTSTTSGSISSNKLNFISVGTTFRSQLAELMTKLRSTGSHFIRCIKPNSEMVAHKFEGNQILAQLHCSGMDSVLELMQRGFPSRSTFNDIYAAYRRLLPAHLARLDSHLFCRALFKAIGLSDDDFRFGSSKVFFRAGKFAEFDQIIRSDAEHVAKLVERVSRWLLRSRWRKAQYCCLCVIKLNAKILYRRQMILRLQKNWRSALLMSKIRFRLNAIKTARQIRSSLEEFELIASKQLKRHPNEQLILQEQSQVLKNEIDSFVNEIKRQIQSVIIPTGNETTEDTNNNTKGGTTVGQSQLAQSKTKCQSELDKLSTKRDLLLRSMRDKIEAKQKELAELERRLAAESKRREEEEFAKRREEQLKEQRDLLESRRQQELAANSNKTPDSDGGSTKRESINPSRQFDDLGDDQEQRDYGIALRLAQEAHMRQLNALGHPSGGAQELLQQHTTQALRRPLAPSENFATSGAQPNARYDLTKWKYSDLRDTINTSCDLELLEACKREFHRRLKVYHAWRAANSHRSVASAGNEQRAPQSILAEALNSSSEFESVLGKPVVSSNEQRYFRIPFVKGSSGAGGQRGWWFAHFDGQWIARQLELHPDRKPILLVAGQHDIEMCELSLRETRLTSKRGAEILPHEFEDEWRKHGGQAYVSKSIQGSDTSNKSNANKENPSILSTATMKRKVVNKHS